MHPSIMCSLSTFYKDSAEELVMSDQIQIKYYPLLTSDSKQLPVGLHWEVSRLIDVHHSR